MTSRPITTWDENIVILNVGGNWGGNREGERGRECGLVILLVIDMRLVGEGWDGVIQKRLSVLGFDLLAVWMGN